MVCLHAVFRGNRRALCPVATGGCDGGYHDRGGVGAQCIRSHEEYLGKSFDVLSSSHTVLRASKMSCAGMGIPTMLMAMMNVLF